MESKSTLMEPLCIQTQAMTPCLTSRESNTTPLKRHTALVFNRTRTHGANWPRPLPPSPHLTNSKPSGAITKSSSECKHLLTRRAKKRLGGKPQPIRGGYSEANDQKRGSHWEGIQVHSIWQPKIQFILSMCDTDLIFQSSVWTQKIQSFQSDLGGFDMWSLIRLCVQFMAMWPEREPSDWNWMVSLTPVLFVMYT